MPEVAVEEFFFQEDPNMMQKLSKRTGGNARANNQANEDIIFDSPNIPAG